MIKSWLELDWVIMAIDRAGSFIDSCVIANFGLPVVLRQILGRDVEGLCRLWYLLIRPVSRLAQW